MSECKFEEHDQKKYEKELKEEGNGDSMEEFQNDQGFGNSDGLEKDNELAETNEQIDLLNDNEKKKIANNKIKTRQDGKQEVNDSLHETTQMNYMFIGEEEATILFKKSSKKSSLGEKDKVNNVSEDQENERLVEEEGERYKRQVNEDCTLSEKCSTSECNYIIQKDKQLESQLEIIDLEENATSTVTVDKKVEHIYSQKMSDSSSEKKDNTKDKVLIDSSDNSTTAKINLPTEAFQNTLTSNAKTNLDHPLRSTYDSDCSDASEYEDARNDFSDTDDDVVQPFNAVSGLCQEQSHHEPIISQFQSKIKSNADLPSNFITIPVLKNEGFRLGALYDARTGMISEETFWDTSAVESMKKTDFNWRCYNTIHETDTSLSRSEMIGIDCNYSLPVWCHYDNDYFNANTVVSNSVNTSLFCQKSSYSEWIPIDISKYSEEKLNKNLDMKNSTHVVIELQYGENIIIELCKEVISEGQRSEIRSDLKNELESVINNTIQENKQSLRSFRCYKDFECSKNIANQEELLSLYSSWKELSLSNVMKKPMQAWLVPISYINSQANEQETSLDVSTQEKCFQRFDELSIILGQVEKMLHSKACHYFQTESRICKRFYQLVIKHKNYFKQILDKQMEMLCASNNKTSIRELISLLKKHSTGAFSYKSLQIWLDNKQTEINALEKMVAEICKNNSNIEVSDKKSRKDSFNGTVYASFEVYIDNEDSFIDKMENNLKSSFYKGDDVSLKSNIVDELSNCSLLIKWFQNFANANVGNKNVRFVIEEVNAAKMKKRLNALNIVFHNGNSSFCLNDIVSSQIKIDSTVHSHCLCKISWSQFHIPNLAIQHYILNIFAKTSHERREYQKVESVSTEETGVLLKTLLPSRVYQIEIIPMVSGLALPGVWTVFKTPPEPNPMKVKTDKIGSTFIHFSWKNMNETLCNEEVKCKVSLDKSSSKGLWENLRIDFVEPSVCFHSFDDLKANTRYRIKVEAIANDGTHVQSIQCFCTTDSKNIGEEVLLELWNFLFSNEFTRVSNKAEFIEMLPSIAIIKQKFTAAFEDQGKSFVLQLFSAVELKSFFDKCVDINFEKEAVLKFEEIVSPLNIYKEQLIGNELKISMYSIKKEKSKFFADGSAPTVSYLVRVYCKNQNNNNFKTDFSASVSKFLRYVDKNYNKLEHFILFLMLQKYDVDESALILNDISCINVEELLVDLIYFEEYILRQPSSSKFQVNCMEYAMNYSYNKKDDYKTILSMFPEICPEIHTYLKRFLLQWKESMLQEFLSILGTSRNFQDFFEKLGISEDLKNTFSEILKKKNESQKEKILTEYSELEVEKVTEKFMVQSKEIFERLNFETYLEQSLSQQDAYSVECSSGLTVKPLPIAFLEHLLMLDYRCRSSNQDKESTLQVDIGNDDLKKGVEDDVEDDHSDDDIFSTAFNANSKLSSSNSSPEVTSNADIVAAAVIACDPFLRQDVFEKLAACQLAIPVVFSNPKTSSVVYNLWALKAIKKKWKNNISHKSLEANISSYSCKTISFCRFGEVAVSKSKVANVFLSSAQGRPDHSFFLNRDNDSASTLTNGNIEVCWYTPEGSDKENIQDLTCLYNLRGDARENRSRFEFLLNVSNVLVIFVGKDPLTKSEQMKLKSCKAQIIVIQTELEGSDKIIKKGNIDLLFSKGKTISNIGRNICNRINSSDGKNFGSIYLTMEQHADIARKMRLEVDEDDQYCREGKEHADEFIKLIEKFNLEEIKDNVVPLQGKYWKSWAEKDKEEFRHKFRSDASDPQSYSSELREKKKYFRLQQVEKKPSKALLKLLESLIQLPKCSRKFYLHFVQLYLNQLSEENLPKLLEDYNQSTSELNNLKKELEKLYEIKSANFQKQRQVKSSIETLMKTVKDFSTKFDVASFGIEHIFREIAQIFECFTEAQTNTPELIDELPKLMVDLMLEGYPVEIMDGNVSHIPITWLEKVFLELKKRLKNARIYVVSIIGIQSSGKSTFLNTMHGCKFSVSSGRCTRGVFVQLLPVKKEYRESLKCDYYLLMDTEGLRSPELGDSFHHDNEIATLISCLANLTIINFWGQTFSKDMADVILIAAYAYMRMNEVKIKSSFHMIFAGVQDVTAAEKNKLGVSKIMEEINAMIENVAKKEGRVDLCRGLRSIFPMLQESYESLNFPQFLPMLWHSSMSPPESRYGELVIDLKNSIMNTLNDPSGHRHVQTIQEFLNRLKDIWRAIKMENFVFGFRNTQAIDVFNQMQSSYEEGLENLREMFFKIAWPYERKANESLGESDLEELINSYKLSIYENLKPQLEEKSKVIVENLKEYIAALSNPDHGMMHLPTFEMHLKKTIEQLLENNIERVEKNIRVQKKSKVSGKEKQMEFKKMFLGEARKLAIQVRNSEDPNASLSEVVITEKFEGLFKQFLLEAQKEDDDMFHNFKGMFGKLFRAYQNYLVEKLDHIRVNRASSSKYITKLMKNSSSVKSGEIMPRVNEKSVGVRGFVAGVVAEVKTLAGYSNKNNIIEEAIKILKLIEREMKGIVEKASEQDFASEEILSVIMGYVSKEIERENRPWFFQRHFQMKVYINVYFYVICKLEKLELEKLKRFSLVLFFKNEEKNFRKMFKDDCTTADLEMRSIEMYFQSALLPSILLRIKMRMGNEIYHNLTKIQVFSLKKRMFYEIERDLLDGSASDVREYSMLFEIHVKNWINKKVVEICEKDEFLKSMIETKTEVEKFNMIKTLKEVEVNISKEDAAKSDWYNIMSETLNAEPMVKNNDEDGATLKQLANGGFVVTELIRLLEEFDTDDLYEILLNACQDNSMHEGTFAILEWFDFDPLKNLTQERIGCTAQCPLCGVKCASDFQCIEPNRHKASMHRPEGFVGYRYTWTSKLTSNICTYLVCSNTNLIPDEDLKRTYNIKHNNSIPYKELHNVITDWFIPELRDSESTIFWQYLFAKHQQKLASDFGAKPADMPSGWYSITKTEALESLKKMHGINSDE